MIPERIGRYQVHSILGAGGFATVFLAHDPDLEAWVAIKVLADNMARDAEFRHRFVREARVMRQLQTPGLVTVYDIGDHQGAPYFVMEYCQRGTLADRIEGLGRPLSAAEGYQLAGAIAACTGHIHRAGMVHRDLKPSNYLIRSRRHTAPVATAGATVLSPDEELAVADFGLAKVVDLDASRVSIAGGTPGYSAPEQFRGDPSVDASADVYAASAMIAAAVTGRQPTPVLAPGDAAFQAAELAAAGPMAGELSRGLAIEKSLRHADINAWYQALTSTVSGPAPGRATMAAPNADLSPATSLAPPEAADPISPDLAPPAAGSAPAASGSTAPLDPGPRSTPGGPTYTPPSGPPSTYPPPNVSAPSSAAPQAPAAFHGGQASPTGQPVTPAPYQAPSTPDSPVDSTPTNRTSRLPLLLGLGVIAVLAIGGLAAVFSGRLLGSDSAITGPTAGLVGQEAVFTTSGGSPGTWDVNGTRFQGRSIAVVPSSAGWIEIALDVDGDSSELVFTATESPGGVDGGGGPTIEGPGTVTVGQAVQLQAGGVDTGAWTVNGEQHDGAAIEVTPTSPGTITVLLEAGGSSVERVITAIEDN